jgi:predicted RNase H-like HicB family nuclease
MEKRHYPVIVEQDRDGVFIVTCPVFEGCYSYGHTIGEAMKNIEEAIASCLDDDEVEHGPTTLVGITWLSS